MKSSTLNKKITSFSWKEYKLDISPIIISNEIISYFIKLFYNDIIKKDSFEYSEFAIILKVQFKDNTIRSISKVLILNSSTPLEEINDLLLMYWTLRSDHYHLKEIKELFILYKILSKKYKHFPSNIKLLNQLKYSNKNISNEYSYNGYNLPNTIDISAWGKWIHEYNNKTLFIESNISAGKQTIYYNVFKEEDSHLVQVFSNSHLLFTFKDEYNQSKSNNTFKRIINNNEFIFNNGVIINKK